MRYKVIGNKECSKLFLKINTNNKRKQKVSFEAGRFEGIVKEENFGFTLIELVSVIAIISVLIGIAIPTYCGFMQVAESRLCEVNRSVIERLYTAYLLENEHADRLFNQFFIENFDEICPADGAIGYVDGKVKCSVHIDKNESADDEQAGGEVPWL
ncbi:putative major pilin subunit [Acetobacterium wieringae]|uniref:Putative major pilin subunit n=1 Tax=Acetobacterium wieringae TaxID=52694 RepID=A0A1F2PKC3_9FIRM|nr:putative major pilin subunit [Acetobacterium wieringae]